MEFQIAKNDREWEFFGTRLKITAFIKSELDYKYNI